MNKYYIPLLFLAVLVLVLFTKFGLKGGPGLGTLDNQASSSAVAAFPSSNNVDRWQLYTNAELGFSLQFPPTWEVDPIRSDRSKSGDDVVFYVKDSGPEQHEGISVDLSHGKDVDELVAGYKGPILSSRIVTIDGEFGKEIETGEMALFHIYVVHDGKAYTFTTQGAFERDGVLATFKFL